MDIHNQSSLFSIFFAYGLHSGMRNRHFIISDKFRRTQIGVLRRDVPDDPGGFYECPDRFAKQPRELPVAAFAKLG
jgi:hypothetical protein